MKISQGVETTILFGIAKHSGAVLTKQGTSVESSENLQPRWTNYSIEIAEAYGAFHLKLSYIRSQTHLCVSFWVGEHYLPGNSMFLH